MKTSAIPLKFIDSIPRPTCGVEPGKGCVLHAGGLRSTPRVDRKLMAAEAIEKRETRQDS